MAVVGRPESLGTGLCSEGSSAERPAGFYFIYMPVLFEGSLILGSSLCVHTHQGFVTKGWRPGL